MNQTEEILAHLKSGKTMSQAQCYHLGMGWRLGARVWDLRHGKHDGYCHNIKKTMPEGYAVYELHPGVWTPEDDAAEASSLGTPIKRISQPSANCFQIQGELLSFPTIPSVTHV